MARQVTRPRPPARHDRSPRRQPGPRHPRELVSLREEIATCDQKLPQDRAALDSGADPAVVGQWITETQARKLAVDARLRDATGARPGPERMTKEQIAATATAIGDLMQALRYATTEDKAEIYTGLNLQLTYNPGQRTMGVRPKWVRHVRKGRVRGRSRTNCTCWCYGPNQVFCAR